MNELIRIKVTLPKSENKNQNKNKINKYKN